MRQLVVTFPAEADLAEITDYLLRNASPTVAFRVVGELRDTMDRLADGSAAGHLRLDLAPEPTLFYLVFRYPIVSRMDRGPLEVLRALHSAQDVQALLA